MLKNDFANINIKHKNSDLVIVKNEKSNVNTRSIIWYMQANRHIIEQVLAEELNYSPAASMEWAVDAYSLIKFDFNNFWRFLGMPPFAEKRTALRVLNIP